MTGLTSRRRGPEPPCKAGSLWLHWPVPAPCASWWQDCGCHLTLPITCLITTISSPFTQRCAGLLVGRKMASAKSGNARGR